MIFATEQARCRRRLTEIQKINGGALGYITYLMENHAAIMPLSMMVLAVG